MLFLIGPLPTAPSQFEVGSSSVTIPDLAHEATAFFTRFYQLEVDDLGPADFWAILCRFPWLPSPRGLRFSLGDGSQQPWSFYVGVPPRSFCQRAFLKDVGERDE